MQVARVQGMCARLRGGGRGGAGTCERQAPNVRVSGVGLKGVVPACLLFRLLPCSVHTGAAYRPPMCMCMYAELKRPDPFL